MTRLWRTNRQLLYASLGVAVCLTGCKEPAAQSNQGEEEEKTEKQAEPKKPPQQMAGEGKVEEKADQLVREMSDYLRKLDAFSLAADHTLEVVTEAGEKLEFGATSRVSLKRPDKLRVDRKGEVADVSLYYNGEMMTLYGRRAKLYASAKAPKSIDAAIDFGRDALGLEAPGADILFSDPYEVLMDDVVSGRYIGKSEVRGRVCHHLAFRDPEVDWQLWVADGKKPLPCKYVVTSKRMHQAPEYSVELHNWKTNPKLSNKQFSFRPPKGAAEIDFFGVKEETKEMKRESGEKKE